MEKRATGKARRFSIERGICFYDNEFMASHFVLSRRFGWVRACPAHVEEMVSEVDAIKPITPLMLRRGKSNEPIHPSAADLFYSGGRPGSGKIQRGRRR